MKTTKIAVRSKEYRSFAAKRDEIVNQIANESINYDKTLEQCINTRNRLRLTKLNIASMLHCTTATINNLESKKTKNWPTLIAYCWALNQYKQFNCKTNTGLIPWNSNCHLVGGKIFHIDYTSSGGAYTFYDRDGNVLTDVCIGDAPYAYTVTGTPNKDKFYIVRSEPIDSKTWTYKNSCTCWMYNPLDTSDTIGSGKTNTALIMAADYGAYMSYPNTIWNALKALNDNATDGCNDWFVPSKMELEALRLARDRYGNVLTTLFSNTYIWSSSGCNAMDAWLWYGYRQNWYYGSKDYGFTLLATRAF